MGHSKIDTVSLDNPEIGADGRIFVYGTLRKGFRSHRLLQRFHPRFLGAGSTRGRLYDLGEYPGAAKSMGNTDSIYGEVYWLPRAQVAFRVLDRFEGFDPAKRAFNEFERKETTVMMAGGDKIRAWIYWLVGVQVFRRRILSGNYALHRK